MINPFGWLARINAPGHVSRARSSLGSTLGFWDSKRRVLPASSINNGARNGIRFTIPCYLKPEHPELPLDHRNSFTAALETSVDEEDLLELLNVLPEDVPDPGPTMFLSEMTEQASEQVTELAKGGN
nr:hypothetical protein Iba_chr11bCG7120 [Ipomoea batatas]